MLDHPFLSNILKLNISKADRTLQVWNERVPPPYELSGSVEYRGIYFATACNAPSTEKCDVDSTRMLSIGQAHLNALVTKAIGCHHVDVDVDVDLHCTNRL
jgi:hypothetical protein